MDEHCWCGRRLENSYEMFRCSVCVRPCCPACADQRGTARICVPCVTAGWAAGPAGAATPAPGGDRITLVEAP